MTSLKGSTSSKDLTGQGQTNQGGETSGSNANPPTPQRQPSALALSSGSGSTSVIANPNAAANALHSDDSDEEGMVKALRRMGIRSPRPFDPKKDRNFENWLDRTEFHLQVTKCPDADKTGSLLLLLDVECFEVAKHLGIGSQTPFAEAKKKLKDYFAITETTEELREKLYLRQQEAGESIEAFARDIKLIGHRAYPKGDPELLEDILIKQFTSGLKEAKSRERVILKNPKTLTEAAQYARFSEAAERVARGHSSTPQSAVSSLNFRKRGASSGARGESLKTRDESHNRFSNFRGRGASRSRGRGAPTAGFRSYSANPRFGQASQSGQGPVRCFNCQKLGHMARECRAPSSRGFGRPRDSDFGRPRDPSSNWREPPTQSWRNRANPSFKHRVATVGNATEREFVEEEQDEIGEASGYTANGISSIGSNSEPSTSALHQSRKLLAVPGLVNGIDLVGLLVDCGSPVTLIRTDLWHQVRREQDRLTPEREQFQGVTRDGLKVLGLAHLRLQFGDVDVEHPVVVVDKIAHRFILGNDFLVQYQCDILNSKAAILFGTRSVPYKLFRSTVNLICPVVCPALTEIGPYEEAVIPGLLDSYKSYDVEQTLLLEPRKKELMQPLIAARVLVNFVSPVVPILVSNLSSEIVSIPKGRVLADESPVRLRRVDLAEPPEGAITIATADIGSSKDTSALTEAMSNADKSLSSDQRGQLERLLRQHFNVFSAGPQDLGRTSLIYHRIDTGDSGPVRQAMRRVPHEHIPVLKAEVDKLQKAGAVEPSSSPFASPTILVKKKDGSMRLCIDYRKLNAVTKKDAHPLPRIEDIFDTLSGSKYFCTLDLAMGYHQVEVHPEDREKTAFSTPFGLFQYNVMPFGLATAPATFMRLMTLVFSGMLYTTCLAYLDDIIIFGRTFEEMLRRLNLALERLEKANLKLKPSKCSFGKQSVSFLGHVISDKGISTDPEKLRRIQEWPRPHNQNEARSFLGYATYYRKFIRGFAHIAEPLHKLLQKEHEFYWSSECEESFKTIKAAFADTITLAYPDFSKPFIVDCDASDFGIGGVLSQIVRPGVEQPVSYFSRTLSKPERKYAVTRKEMLALVESLKHFRCYILGRKFKVRTDHSALQWLRTFKEPVGQVARWVERLAEYDFDIEHRPGKQHANADALSRYPIAVASVTRNEQWLLPQWKADFVKHQNKDRITSVLISWCKKAQRPREEQIEGAPQELWYYWSRFDELTIQDGILCLRTAIGDGPDTILRAVVPQSARQEILEMAHGSATGGHFGVQKTTEKLKQRFHWMRITRDVKYWCEKCPTCNRHKTHNPNRAPLKPIYTGEPFERVAMDLIGPLPRTERGNRYILTVVDHFTKHVEAYPLPDQEAVTIARVFMNEFISRFGVPYVIHTDQGANFESNLFKELCKMLNIKKTRTTPYHPQCDGQVERMNRTLIELLALNVENPTENWDLNLGLVLMSYRSAVQSSTGHTPYFMLFGREMRLPLDIMYRPPEIEHTRSEYPNEVRKVLEHAYERARDRLHMAHERQKDYYDRRGHGSRFKVGDSVWLYSPVVGKGVAPKFHEPWTGPYKVSKRLSDITYEVEDIQKKTTKVVHFDRLKHASIKPVEYQLSDIEAKSESDADSDTQFETLDKPRRKLFPTKAPSPTVGDPVEAAARPPTAPPVSSRQGAPAKPPRREPTSNVERQIAVPNVEAEAEIPRREQSPQADRPAKPAQKEQRVHEPIRVSTRSNKGQAPRRYSPSSNLVTTAFVALLFFCFATTPVSARDVIVLPKLGAVAEKVGEVALDLGAGQFSMILRLGIHDTVNHGGHSCTPNDTFIHYFSRTASHLMPTWLEKDYMPTPLSQARLQTRSKRSPLLAAIGAAVGVSALFNIFSGSLSSKEIANIKEQQTHIFQHIQTMQPEITLNHDNIVKVTTLMGSLYEYTHESFRNQSYILKNFQCETTEKFRLLGYAIQYDRIMSKLYADLLASIVSIFNHHPTPILLPPHTLRHLINENLEFFAGNYIL